MVRTITNIEAAAFFAHPSQRKASGLTGTPEDWMQYRASGDFCGAFHMHLWPGVWMGHLAAKPGAWGNCDADALAILQAFAAEMNPTRIIGWLRERNRAALALCRRIGFETDGRLPLADPVVMIGWEPKWQ